MFRRWHMHSLECCHYVFVPRFRESTGTLNLIRPPVCPSVHLSVRLSVTKTLTLAITFALLQVELWYLACVFFVTRPFRWYHVMTFTVTFDLLQGQICCRAGDHNSLNLLVTFTPGYMYIQSHLIDFKLENVNFRRWRRRGGWWGWWWRGWGGGRRRRRREEAKKKEKVITI